MQVRIRIPLFILMWIRIRLRIQIRIQKTSRWEKNKKVLQIFNYFFQNLSKLVMSNFLSYNAGGGVRVEALNLRDKV